ncbi:type II toxin-antitoxin system VapC family toxin [Candidatus Methylospira mobilis]|uniref:Type II toxin-antitoxin system VapC family toxin n=1 Tax=Candidatus Methylospira mobilis TaxID=1808979 RepID=A0A5Q0BKR4_9GAMM|nr:type II toxin-antitoxin system VapC family toxin [Candidatus Methylospira mobilis]QFY42707.1 type II toxin-antitoxin system VapC family toxin [Candidatus Methylospira mobilis]WNV04172.1 type II toxin-antitoxin system VapC family toxin [Candidatus Methylospira mobilis]
MHRYLIDTNVIIDVSDPQSEWYGWSSSQLVRATDSGEVFINPIIYAELAGYADSEAQIESILSDMLLERADLPWQAAFLAGRAFVAYRKSGGTRTLPLPDFYIGAHAQVAGLTLLTRDVRRFRAYFPRLRLIAPDSVS